MLVWTQALRAIIVVCFLGFSALASAEPFAYIANRDADIVSVIDTATDTVVSTISVGDYPHGVAVTPNGKLVFVANRAASTVSVIDTATRTVTATISVGSLPISVAIDAAGTFAYVATRGNDMINIIDTNTLASVGTIRVSDAPSLIITHPTLARAYIAHNGVNGGTTLSVIDTQTRAVLNTLSVGTVIVGMTLHPDGKTLYLVDEPARSVIKVDLTTLQVISTVVVGGDTYGVAIAPSGSPYFVSDIQRQIVSVIDSTTNAIQKQIPVGKSPKGVQVHPDGKRLYVSNLDSGTVSIIDMVTGVVTTTVTVGLGPVGTGQIFSPLVVTPPPVGKPNVIFMITDDMRKDDMAYMPNLQALLVNQGMKFEEGFVVNGTCCPARAAVLRGQYPKNSGVTRVGDGFVNFRNGGSELDTLATQLHDAGYRTGLYGKYFIDYPAAGNPTYTPPGWDDWVSLNSVKGYFKYELVENGLTTLHGDAPEDYLTDVLANRVQASIARAAADPRPFFLYVAHSAPHEPATPAPRHASLFADLLAPRPPSFDESNVNDKPKWIQNLKRLDTASKGSIDALFRDRLRSLQAVDEMLGTMVASLESLGILNNTYIIFTSDQGFSQGEHRIKFGKGNPYEEVIRVPFIVRGPNVLAATISNSFVLHTDIMPTILDIATHPKPSYIDGRSLMPLLGGAPEPTVWRKQFMIDHNDIPLIELSFAPPSHRAVRTKSYTYVEYPVSGEHEFYDLKQDPFQLNNTYATASAGVLQVLAGDLAALSNCAGSSCMTAEDAVHYALTVTLSGLGVGTVTASDGLIGCGSDCSEVYAENANVTLTAMPIAGAYFAGWSGACTNLTGTCVVNMNASKTATALFSFANALTVTRTGSGVGTVTSSDGLINCGTDCAEDYAPGTLVTLTASSTLGSRFAGWSSACINLTGDCVVTMDAVKTASARFDPSTSILTISKQGNGIGTVTASDNLINCGADCTEIYPTGTVVTLTATAASGSTFSTWDNTACPGTGSCTVTMDVGKTLRPRFIR